MVQEARILRAHEAAARPDLAASSAGSGHDRHPDQEALANGLAIGLARRQRRLPAHRLSGDTTVAAAGRLHRLRTRWPVTIGRQPLSTASTATSLTGSSCSCHGAAKAGQSRNARVHRTTQMASGQASGPQRHPVHLGSDRTVLDLATVVSRKRLDAHHRRRSPTTGLTEAPRICYAVLVSHSRQGRTGCCRLPRGSGRAVR